MQVLVESLPVALASVDCDGTETSLLACSSSEEDLQECGIANTNLTKATVLACGKAGNSAPPTPSTLSPRQLATPRVFPGETIRRLGHSV